jgi:cell division protein FtsB
LLRITLALLLIAILWMQYRLWLAPDGMRDVWRLRAAVAAQQEENRILRERNASLAAEVGDLKEGLEAVEERARADLGMIEEGETFYQVVEGTNDSEPPSEK